MHAKYLGFGMVLAIATAAGAGCSSESVETTDGSDSGVTSSSSGNTGGKKDGGGGGDDAGPSVPNDSFETATLLATAENGSLTYSDDADTDNRLSGSITPGKASFYYIDLDEASTGNPMIFLVESRTTAADDDDTKYDLHVTLYNEDKEQVAANDDTLTAFATYRDPALLNVPLEAGRYYIKVQPFCAVDGADCDEGWEAPVTDPSFRIGGGYLNVEGYGIDSDDSADKNGTPATAVALPLTARKNTDQAIVVYDASVFGASSSATDLDFYKLNVPADLVVAAAHRVSFNVVFPAGGVNGTGATSTATAAWIVDSADPTKKVATVDLKAAFALENASVLGANVNVPLLQNHDYYLVVQNADATDGNYYFAQAAAYAGNPLESDVAGANDTPEGANVLTSVADQVAYFIEGDLGAGVALGDAGVDAGPVAADVDFFKVAVSGKTKISVSCGAQSGGSGLRGLKATVLNGAAEVTSAIEVPASGLSIQQFAIPGGAADLLIKLEATAAQAADVTGAFYRCGIRLD